ncbi:MAG: hypothetical protein AAF902_03150 [Chloroflexota bacterium]
MKKLVFIIERSPYLKHFGSIIDEALKQNFPVECWALDGRSNGGSKAYTYLTPEKVPHFDHGQPKIVWFNSSEQMGGEASRTDILAAFATRKKYKTLGTTATNFRYITIQVGIDTFVGATLDELLASDLICVLSPFWLDWAADYYTRSGESRAREKLQEKMIFTGFPFIDGASQVKKLELRKKFGIPKNKNVVLLLPITLKNKRGAWSKFFSATSPVLRSAILVHGGLTESQNYRQYIPWITRGWHDDRLNHSIRAFCDANNGWLVAKGRLKDPVRPSLQKISDQFIYDDEDYPATILQLMSIASVCIHFYSTAALELAYLGVPGICIDRPSPVFPNQEWPPLFHQLWRLNQPNTAYNWPGVNSWLSLPDAFTQLASLKLAQIPIDHLEQTKYIQTYIDQEYQLSNSSGNQSSAKRILDSVTTLQV